MQTRRTNPEQTTQIHFREPKDGDTCLVCFDGEERVTKEQKELWGMMHTVVVVSHMPGFLKLYTLSMYSLLYDNYTSIKLYMKSTKKRKEMNHEAWLQMLMAKVKDLCMMLVPTQIFCLPPILLFCLCLCLSYL